VVERRLRVAGDGVYDAETGALLMTAPALALGVVRGGLHDGQLVYDERPSGVDGAVWCRASVRIGGVTIVGAREELVPILCPVCDARPGHPRGNGCSDMCDDCYARWLAAGEPDEC